MEFHRQRIARFVRVAKEAIDDGVWLRLQTAHPDLLADVMEGRSIEWDSVDSAEHAQFGRGKARQLLRGAEAEFNHACEKLLPALAPDEQIRSLRDQLSYARSLMASARNRVRLGMGAVPEDGHAGLVQADNGLIIEGLDELGGLPKRVKVIGGAVLAILVLTVLLIVVTLSSEDLDAAPVPTSAPTAAPTRASRRSIKINEGAVSEKTGTTLCRIILLYYDIKHGGS